MTIIIAAGLVDSTAILCGEEINLTCFDAISPNKGISPIMTETIPGLSKRINFQTLPSLVSWKTCNPEVQP